MIDPVLMEQGAPLDSRLCIAGDGIPDDVLHRFAVQAGWAIVAQDLEGKGDDLVRVLLFAEMTEERLAPAMAKPFHGYVEFQDEEADLAGLVRTAATEGNFCLSMTTPTAFALDVARLVCDALVARGAMALDQRGGVEMALHEIVANAILHGNLGIDSKDKTDSEHYAGFCSLLAEALNTLSARRRWIGIAASWTADGLEIAVDDQGNGYDVGAGDATHETADLDRPTGRGLAIAHALATSVHVSRGGRRTAVRFRHVGR